MALPQQKRFDPSEPSKLTKLMAPKLDLVRTLMGGTEALRAAGTKYLPQYTAESDLNYEYRLQRAVLLNMFKRAVENLVGKPFSKPINLENFSQPFLEWAEDVDQNGNHLNAFAREVFQRALIDGLVHVLVEYPNMAEAEVSTLEDERRIAPRPYLCLIPHSSVIAAYSTNEHGEEKITHLRLWEEEIVFDGIEEVTIERVRVLEPGSWKLYRKVQNKWEVESQGETSLDEVPFLTFYADREGFMLANPPLMDLAYLNLAHWQSSSDQRNILTLTRFPLLAGKGLNAEEANVAIGPNRLLTSLSPDGEFYYVEHTGAAIAAGRNDLEDLKGEMATVSIELTRQTGMKTATEKALDTAQSLSMLQSMAMRFGDFLEQCLDVVGDWMQLEFEGSITVNSDFGLNLESGVDLATLLQLRDSRQISRQQLVRELKRRNLLSDDYDPEADWAVINQEEDEILAQDMMRNELLGLNPDGSPKEVVPAV